jgi:hypothetical protein
MGGVPNRISYELHLAAEMGVLYSAAELQRTVSGRLPNLDGTCVRLARHRNMSWPMWSTLMLCSGFAIPLMVFVLEHR